METRTVTLRLVVGSRNFAMRRKSLDLATAKALARAASELVRDGFRVAATQGNVTNEGGTINDE